MVEDVVVAVVEVDDIGAGDAAFDEWDMVVFHGVLDARRSGIGSPRARRRVDQVEQPGSELVLRWMLRSASAIMSMTISALIFFSVPSFSHFSARWREP